MLLSQLTHSECAPMSLGLAAFAQDEHACSFHSSPTANTLMVYGLVAHPGQTRVAHVVLLAHQGKHALTSYGLVAHPWQIGSDEQWVGNPPGESMLI